MEEQTITLTEAEFNAKIEEAVKKATTDLTSKHNGELASMRIKLKEAEKKAMSDEERASYEKQIKEETEKATQAELSELRAYKKQSIISDKLTKAGLPNFFKNDTRLMSAEDGDLDKVVKDIKKEFEESMPKGNQHSSVVQTQVGSVAKTGTNDKEVAYQEAAEAFKDLFSK